MATGWHGVSRLEATEADDEDSASSFQANKLMDREYDTGADKLSTQL